MSSGSRHGRDVELIQIVDRAFADSARRSGEWLVCRPGCNQCCVGIFAVNLLDVRRLRLGMLELEGRDPARAEAIRDRSRAAMGRLKGGFPGDVSSGILDEGLEAAARFEELGNDEVCPVLDPTSGRCELYEYRPMTCRVFGPPVRSEDGLGACELCYHGASAEEIAACEMQPDPEDLEAQLLEELETASGNSGETIIAFALGMAAGE